MARRLWINAKRARFSFNHPPCQIVAKLLVQTWCLSEDIGLRTNRPTCQKTEKITRFQQVGYGLDCIRQNC